LAKRIKASLIEYDNFSLVLYLPSGEFILGQGYTYLTSATYLININTFDIHKILLYVIGKGYYEILLAKLHHCD